MAPWRQYFSVAQIEEAEEYVLARYKWKQLGAEKYGLARHRNGNDMSKSKSPPHRAPGSDADTLVPSPATWHLAGRPAGGRVSPVLSSSMARTRATRRATRNQPPAHKPQPPKDEAAANVPCSARAASITAIDAPPRPRAHSGASPARVAGETSPVSTSLSHRQQTSNSGDRQPVGASD